MPGSAGRVEVRADPRHGMGIVSWNMDPFAILRLWSRQLDGMLSVLTASMDAWHRAVDSDLRALTAPVVHIEPHDEGIEVVAELPRADHDQLEVRIDRNVLTIAGERHDEEGSRASSAARDPRRPGRFERTVVLPGEIDVTRSAAVMKHGVLRVSLPHLRRSGRIEVRAE